MSRRKTRERHLAKLAARRAAERRRKRRQRITAAIVALAVAAGGGVFAFVAFTGGKSKPNAKTPTPPVPTTPSASPSPSASYSPGTGKATGTVTPTTAPTVVACGAKPPPDAGKPKPQFNGPPPLTIDKSKTYIATMNTSCGVIKIELLAKTAPITSNSFVFLADHHFFDGTFFLRIADGIDVIQGGDPTGTGTAGPGYQIPDELTGKDTYPPGTLAMANAGPNTGGSQFFLITGPKGNNLDSNPAYTVFGRVVKGLDIAQKIQAIPVIGASPGDPNADGTPSQAIYIDSVTIQVTGGATPSPTKATPKPSASASPTKKATHKATPSVSPTK